MAEPHLLVSRAGGVATVAFNRPATRNAMSFEMAEEFVRTMGELGADASVRAVVLTGTGKSFCSGANLAILAEDAAHGGALDVPAMARTQRGFYASFLTIRDLPVPTIAAVNGHAIGAGFCIALACDLRVAVDDAKLGMTFTRLGIHPGMGSTHTLTRLIGPARAAELFFTGRVIDASEAERLGVVNRVAPRDRFEAVVQELAAEVAGSAPIAVRMVKQSIRRNGDLPLDQVIGLEALDQAVTFGTADAREGILAAQEKRPPRFQGS